MYGDEFKNEKYSYLFRSLLQRVDFVDTLTRAALPPEFFIPLSTESDIPHNIILHSGGRMREKKIVFMGGDGRQGAAAARLSELGYSVSVYGLPEVGGLKRLEKLDAVFTADALVLPLPMSGDGITVSSVGKFRDSAPRIDEILARAKGIPICAGRIQPKIKSEAERLGVRLFDYFLSEELMIKNAYLTAEGAVALAMNELDISLSGARTAVVGYGRIGKFLARMLDSLGADVTVAARRGTDLAYAGGFGYSTQRICIVGGKSTLSALFDCDIIFNTAPYWLFDAEVLEGFSANTLMIDLASAPGGFDPEAVKKLGLRVISAPGLPGKYAPMTAGSFVGDAIAELLPKII